MPQREQRHKSLIRGGRRGHVPRRAELKKNHGCFFSLYQEAGIFGHRPRNDKQTARAASGNLVRQAPSNNLSVRLQGKAGLLAVWAARPFINTC